MRTVPLKVILGWILSFYSLHGSDPISLDHNNDKADYAQKNTGYQELQSDDLECVLKQTQLTDNNDTDTSVDQFLSRGVLPVDFLPVFVWRHITAYLGYETKLHQVNRYLFEAVSSYSMADIAKQGITHHLTLLRPSLAALHGFEIDHGNKGRDYLGTIPSYVWYSFVRHLSNAPLDAYHSIKNTRIRIVSSNNHDNNDLQALCRMLQGSLIHTLDFSHNTINSDTFQSLAALTHLSALNMAHNQITDVNFGYLTTLRNLTFLNVKDNSIDDQCAEPLAKLTNLKHLDLELNLVSKIFCESLTALTNLTELNIQENSIGDAGLLSLTNLTQLRYLNINHTRIGAAGAASVLKLSNLVSLKISGNVIDDSSSEIFTRLTQLEFLDMRLTYINKPAYNALCQSLLHTQIIWSQPNRM